MEIIIKLIFILSMFVFNVSIFGPLYKMTDETKQIAAFMLLAGFNVLATTSLIFILHPHMADNIGKFAFVGCIGGAVLFIVSIYPYKAN